ncbi:MAG: osmoprotectant transport system substrate-binding protein [Pseudonocardiales bacterium]|nr:osmoprotectant transport system substrate-binding protein [Pseudonocardiales bacterium]
MNGRRRPRRHWLAALLAGAVALAGCTPSGNRGAQAIPSDAVVVASFNFDESALLAEIYAQALEHSGIPVHRELRLGPRELVQPALRQGLVDIVPEYLGSALITFDPGIRPIDLGDRNTVLAALRSALPRWGLTVLDPAGASDQNVFTVTRSTARRYGLRTLTDLAAVAPAMTLGGPSECPRRPYCLAGLERVYGIRVRRFVPLDDASQRATALEEGVIDVGVTFSTDGRLAAGPTVALVDDKRLQPIEAVTPLVSRRAVNRHGRRLSTTLDAVSAALDQNSLSFLNWRVSVAGMDPGTEARNWLYRHGLLGGAR